MAAVVLCCAFFFPGKWALAIPLAALLITDAVLNLHAGLPPFTSLSLALLVAFGLVFWLGRAIRRHPPQLRRTELPILLGASVAGTLAFYLVTNTASWFLSSSSVYPATVGGWIQCLTTGTPGFPPTYLFLRNSLAGDLFFTGLFWVLMTVGVRRAAAGATQIHPAEAGRLS